VKGELLYEGKAKKMYAVPGRPEEVWVEYKDSLTAFNAQKTGSFSGKGSINAQITSLLYRRLKEAGIDNMVFQTWIGLLAPARTPRPIVDQLNRQVHAILASEDVKAQLREAGMDVAPTTPEQFAKTIADESRLHAELVKASGLVPQ
jgi:hypothetical protein